MFDGSNYDVWAQEMCIFLKGRILWGIVTGEISKPIKIDNKDKEKFTEQLDTWDGKNHQSLTWFRSTYANVIKLDFCRFDIVKEVWDFLESYYSIYDDIHQF